MEAFYSTIFYLRHNQLIAIMTLIKKNLLIVTEARNADGILCEFTKV